MTKEMSIKGNEPATNCSRLKKMMSIENKTI